MKEMILPGQTIGIMGSNPSVYEVVRTAQAMGYQVGVLTDSATSPAARAADWFIEGSLADASRRLEVAERSDVVIFLSKEWEETAMSTLEPYVAVPQWSDQLAVTKDRLIEKVYLESLNMNVLPYATVTNQADIEEAVTSIGFPCILKSIRIEEQQPKNVVLYSEEDFSRTNALFATGACLLESWVHYEKELLLPVAVGANGNVEAFSLIETDYQDGTLKRSITPAPVASELADTISSMGLVIAKSLATKGLVTVEFFVTPAGIIYVKRIAIIPHQAMLHTMEYHATSFTEALVLAATGRTVQPIPVTPVSTSFYFLNEEAEEIVNAIPDHPEWCVRFLPGRNPGPSSLAGFIRIEGEVKSLTGSKA